MVGGSHSLAYSTFCEYWPTNIVGPGVADWGTRLVSCSLYTVLCILCCIYAVFKLQKPRAAV